MSATGDIHRIGGSGIDNLRLKPRELKLTPPGISVVRSSDPARAIADMRRAYQHLAWVHQSPLSIGTTTLEAIRAAGFDMIAVPSLHMANHCRIIHPAGAAGFTDVNLAALAAAFTDTHGY